MPLRAFFSAVFLGLASLTSGAAASGPPDDRINAPVTAVIPNASFEQNVTGWTVEGAVSVETDTTAPDGTHVLVLKRDPVSLPATRAASEAFAVQPGVWELTGAYAADLHSPDVSFNVTISLQSRNAAGAELKTRRVVSVSGHAAWTRFKERLDLPAGATTARVEIQFEKTHGEFRVDALALTRLGASIPPEGGERKVVFRTNRTGNLFYPGDRVAFDVEIETPVALTDERMRLRWQTTDFYQAPAAPGGETRLEPAGRAPSGAWRYRATVDLSASPLRVGPYYEVNTTLDLGAPQEARDSASFAILPEAVTKDLDPLATPFGAHTWNATVYEYFPLAARLGLRRCLVFWSWPEKPPHAPEFSSGPDHDRRLGWPRRFGLAPYGVLYPAMWAEHRDGPLYSDEALRAGIRESIRLHKKDGLWGFQLGNEPPSWNPAWVKRDVEVYKLLYETIKETDPGIIAIGSAIGPNEAFFQAGFQAYQDVYNLHAYSDLGELRAEMRKYRELFKKYGGEKPIWSTEIGSKSQGLPRDVIARDIIRKAVCFFADGGGFFTWFAVGGMPDPDGENTGSYADSMDLFASRYDMHLPRLDAVAFYHLINTMAAKKFVEERAYPDGPHAFLFRDALGNSLVVLWNEHGARDVCLPLPGVHEVALTWFDGVTRQLDAAGSGVQLRVGDDPMLIAFRADAMPLPVELKTAPTIALGSLPDTLTQGGVAEFTATFAGAPRPLTLTGPSGWEISAPESAPGRITWRVRIPDDTRARAADFRIDDETLTARGDTSLRFSVPVRSRIALNLLPVAGAREGDAAVRLEFTNHADTAQALNWRAEIVDELSMAGGTYKTTEAKPATAFFKGLAADRLTLAPRETRSLVLPLGGVDRLAIYRIRASATDATGNTVRRERPVGGFARVPRASAPPVLDGRLDEAVWKRATVYRLDEARQFCAVESSAKPWAGPADLSALLRFAWDDQNLYLAVEVTDDIFANPQADDLLWNQDGLQFLVDPFRDAERGLGRYDYSLGLGQKGPQAWCHLSADPGAPAGPAPEIRFAVAPVSGRGGSRTYEVAIPWSRLAPFKPARDADLGFTLVINEDDGSGRKSTIGWFGGVHLKETPFVGDLILSE